MSTFLGLSHIAFNVSDMEASSAWYQKHLGFTPFRRLEKITALQHRDSGIMLVLNQADGAAAEGQHFDHLALTVGSRAELEEWSRSLTAQGLHAPVEDGTIGASISLRDPDNLEVELFVPTL